MRDEKTEINEKVFNKNEKRKARNKCKFPMFLAFRFWKLLLNGETKMNSTNSNVTKTKSLSDLKNENRILKSRLKGSEQITESLSIEVDRRGEIISMLQKFTNKQNVIQKRRAA